MAGEGGRGGGGSDFNSIVKAEHSYGGHKVSEQFFLKLHS